MQSTRLVTGIFWSSCLSVITAVSCAKTAELIEMRFGIRTRVGPLNRVLGGGSDPPRGMGNLLASPSQLGNIGNIQYELMLLGSWQQRWPFVIIRQQLVILPTADNVSTAIQYHNQGYDKWRTSEGEAEGCKMAMWGLQ